MKNRLFAKALNQFFSKNKLIKNKYLLFKSWCSKIWEAFHKVATNFYEYVRKTFSSRRFWITHFALIVGNTLVACATNAVLIKLNLVPPGMTGVSIIFFYLYRDLSVGLYYVILNVPIMIIGWRVLSGKFIFNGVFGILYFIIALELTKNLQVPEIIENEPYLMILLGSIASGIGIGFYLRYGASGGSDVIAFVVKRKIGLSLGTTLLGINCANLLLTLIIQDIKTTLFSTIYHVLVVTISTKTQLGFSQKSAIFIISKRYEQISELLNQKLERSSTFVKVVGSYSKQEGYMIFTIASVFEIGRLKEIVHDLDNDALVAVMDTDEVVGQKFVAWEDSGYFKKILKMPSQNQS